VRRFFESLRPADVSAIHSVPDGLLLVRVDRALYRWHKQKPYYEIRFVVLKPKRLTGCLMTGRLYCTSRAMWKLRWFLRDFGYDLELLERNEIDDKALVDQPIPGRTRGTVVSGSATGLLFVDDRNCGGRAGCFRP